MAFTTIAQKVVKVGAFNYYPAIFKDSDGIVKGFYTDALKALGDKENIKFIYVYGTWDEGLERLKNGQVDMLTSVAMTESRLEYMDYTNTPLLTVWSEVYVKPKSEINGILDLHNKTIAIMKSDMNGSYLKNLTTKLSVNCNFIETSDFDEVFKLISENNADAGVVNNTFGAAKSQGYNLRSSGIIFNPFDIFITVKKNRHTELLNLLNSYLHEWKHDPNSVYNISRIKWSHKNIGAIEIFPAWVKKGFYITLTLLIVLFVFVVLLNYKVKIATEKVKYSERLFETFMANTPAYVYIKDQTLHHLYQNRMIDMLNTSSPTNKNSSARTIFDTVTAGYIEKADREILSGKTTQTNLQYECVLNGRKMWLHDYKFSFQLPDGQAAVAGISFDITNLKQTEAELRNAKIKAEESDRLKTAFLANMSHEIRTPMNGILGFAQMLHDDELDKETHDQYLNIIETCGERLLNIINDIVDISKIEAGLMPVELVEFELTHHLEHLYKFFSPEATSKGIKLIYNHPTPELNPVIFTDREKFYAIFTNLIKNAIKYTVDGEIEFGYTKNTDDYIFYVKDTGIGIRKEMQTAIFERFIQVENTIKNGVAGTGLGLSITKAYIEMLGGNIRIESEPDKGSTFIFNLPAKRM